MMFISIIVMTTFIAISKAKRLFRELNLLQELQLMSECMNEVADS